MGKKREPRDEERETRFHLLMDWLSELHGNQAGAAAAMRINRASFHGLRSGETPISDRHAALAAVALDLPASLVDEYMDGRISLEGLKDSHRNHVAYLVAQVRQLPFDQQLDVIHGVTSRE